MIYVRHVSVPPSLTWLAIRRGDSRRAAPDGSECRRVTAAIGFPGLL